MAIGLDADTEYARRSETLGGGAFSDFFAGVWVYRPSSTATYALTAGGFFIHGQAGAREIGLGFNSAGSNLADLNLQVTYNSGGGAGTPATFSGHAGNSFLDEWVYYFFCAYGGTTGTQEAGYIRLSAPTTIVSLTRTNDNAGSQSVDVLTFGNHNDSNAVVLGHYAYARAVEAASFSSGTITTYAGSSTTETGDWGFWPLADNTDTGDDSGNARTLTFSSGLSSETSPTLGSSGSTGTVAYTLLNDTLAALGTTTVVGSLAETMTNDTSSATGTTTVVGSLAVTLANDTGAISGSVGSPVSGTLAVTLQNDTVSASGTTTIVGSLAETMTNDTSSASGTTTVVGALAETLADDTLAASGSVGSAVGGTLNVTLQSDTLAAQGTSTVLASLLYTLLNDTSAISATTTVTGTVAVTNQNDILSAGGTVGTPPAGQGTRLILTGAGAS